MTTFARTRAMHQFYRDVFSRSIYLPEADALPAHLVVEILNYANSDINALNGLLQSAETDLEPEQDRALKLMMGAIAMANEAFDGHSTGMQAGMPAEKVTLITNQVVEAMQLSDNVNYLVASIQILFRINEIDSVLFLISNNLSTLSETPCVLKILLLICLMEEDYNQAQIVIQQLTSDPDFIGEDTMTLVMVVCGIYKMGGYPEAFIDFRPLLETGFEPDTDRYKWLIEPDNNGKTTVVVGCDKNYFYQHAIALLFSLYETNRDELNVHLHIYNCDEQIQRDVQSLCAGLEHFNVSLSSESFTCAKDINVHYASRRFVFLRHAMSKLAGPVMVLDADCLVRKSWSSFKTTLGNQKMIVSWAEGAPFWEDIIAGFIYSEGGAVSDKFFDAVARFIDSNLSSGNAVWFLDQIALACAMNELSAVEQMSIGREKTSSLVDIKHSEDAFSWVVTTVKNGQGVYQDYKQALLDKYTNTTCVS